MNVVPLATPPSSFSITDRAPIRSADSSFMGLMETIAWVGLRDERAALAARWHSLDRPDFDAHWTGAAEDMLREDMAAKGVSIRAVKLEVFDKCAAGALEARGCGPSGFTEIPANDWLGARLADESKRPDSILCAGTHGEGWTRVQFRRSDVLELWPSIASAQTPVAELPPAKSKTNKRPPWYPVLRTWMEAEDQRIRNLERAKPDIRPPQFPTAVKWRNQLIAKGFADETLPQKTVSYHVRNIKIELGR